MPYCTGVVPYTRLNNSSTDPYGDGTLYPLSLSPEVFAWVFWRVKAWRFWGNLSFGGAFDIDGEIAFDRTFYRNATEGALICAENNIPSSPFTAPTDLLPIEFEGTQDGDAVDLELSVLMRVRASTFGSAYRATMLDVDNTLRCYFAAQLFVTGPSQTATFLQSEELDDTTGDNTVSLELPGIEPIQITMFQPDSTNAILTNAVIEPAEYFEWGGTYDSETGLFV